MTYTSFSSLNNIISCLIENSVFIKSYYNINDFLSLLDFLKVNYNIDFKKFTSITVVNFIKNKLLIYNNLISQYIILLSICFIEKVSDDDNNKSIFNLVFKKFNLLSKIEVLSNIVNCNLVKLN